MVQISSIFMIVFSIFGVFLTFLILFNIFLGYFVMSNCFTLCLQGSLVPSLRLFLYQYLLPYTVFYLALLVSDFAEF